MLSKKTELALRMSSLGIKEEEITERFIRSKGPGGQNVNKTSTCVYLRHNPSGIEVRCQKERSQVLNRYIAKKLLLSKIEAFRKNELSVQRQYIEKARRQKRKRSFKVKMMILREKKRNSEKKAFRSQVREME